MAQPIIVAGATTESCAAVGPIGDHGARSYSRPDGNVKREESWTLEAPSWVHVSAEPSWGRRPYAPRRANASQAGRRAGFTKILGMIP